MTTADELRELARQTRLRLSLASRLRVEQRIITAQSERRLRESRLLLEQSALGRTAAAPLHLHRV